MKLSIIVPVYNSEKYLPNTLKSIQNQTFKDWECILIDDGSTDKSASICDAFSYFDNRFKTIHKYNEGPSASRNLGIYLAKGEFLAFPDSDDILNPNMYEDLLSFSNKYKDIKVFRCNVEYHNLKGDVNVWEVPEGIYDVADEIIMSSGKYDCPNINSSIYHKSVFQKIKFNTKLFFAEDLFLIYEVLLSFKKIFNLNKAYYQYYQHEESLSNKRALVPGVFYSSLNELYKLGEKYKNNSSYKFYKNVLLSNFLSRPSVNRIRSTSIDLVLPYVNNKDPIWQSAYKQHVYGVRQESIGEQRFNGDDSLLRYNLRSIAKNAPFVDMVHLLVASKSQVPEWINEETVHIVYHKDFIPEEYLPTFNSTTIEMFLHKIPLLAENFIYTNDDVYFLDIVKPKFYLRDNKIVSKLDLHKSANTVPIWKSIIKNSYELIFEKDFNPSSYYAPPHVESFFKKSLCQEVFDLYSQEILSRISSFREDKNLNQYIYTYYFHKTQRVINDFHSYACITNKVSNKEIAKFFEKDTKVRTLAVNDENGSEDFLKYKLSQEFPKLSKYEKF